jgi:hypothetical protein
MIRRSSLLLVVTGCIAMFALVGCGKSSSSSSSSAASTPAAVEPTATSTTAPATKFAKTKFVFHAALAFGAFHHFIYKPFRAGDFKHPLLHKLTLLKAGLAGLFVYHELKLAATDVKSSKLLSALFSPITLVASKLQALKSSLTSGKASASDLEGVKSGLDQVGSAAASKGTPIKEAIPSVAQLASPPA